MDEYFFCEKCDKKLDHVLLDGYDIDDKLLEGVKFIIEDKGGVPLCTGVLDEHKSYFSKFDKDYIHEATAWARMTDVLLCPHCNWDIAVYHTDDTKPECYGAPEQNTA